MRQELCLLLIAVAACGPPASSRVDTPPKSAASSAAQPVSTIVGPAPIETWLAPDTARTIMAARAEYDAVELALMQELERRMGSYRNVMMITREQYASHLGGPTISIPRSQAWEYEQQQRVAYARF